MEDKKEITHFEVKKVSNGWILEMNPTSCTPVSGDDFSVFNYIEDLAEYLKKIDDK